MKNTKISLLGALAIAGGMFFAGCTEDPCKDVTCVNGECVEGTCVCDAGFEGTDCGTAVNAKFSGTYNLSESCTPTGTANYTVTVSPKSGSNDEANITGLWAEPQFTCVAKVNADGLGFVIERVPVSSITAVAREISSMNGTINAEGTTLTLTYSIYDGTTTTVIDQCVANLTKQ